MAIGARIRQGDGSLIQIDPTWECLGLKSSGSVVCASYTTPGAGGRTVGRATVSLSGCNEPIISVYCSGAFVGIASKTQTGTTFTWDIVASIAGATVSYWVFDTTDVAQVAFSSTNGLRIRNPSNGRVVFDSRYKYMRIMQMVNIDANSNEQNISIPISSAYSVAICNSGFFTTVVGGPVGGGPSWQNANTGFIVGVRTNSNATITIQLITLIANVTDGPSGAPPTGLMGTNNFIGQVLDMRNY